jgi:16S rRNA (uracil1498-N3)-methyltransferase
VCSSDLIVPERRRIYAPPEAFTDGGLVLAGERLRHLRTVLRLRPGDEFLVTDGRGAEYQARIERLGRDAGRASLLARAEPARESGLQVVLAQAVARADRFALVLEKSAELGVAAIVPVLCGRTIRGRGAGAARWERIVESAVAQCGRTRLPALHAPRSFDELTRDAGLAPLRILLWERSVEGLRDVLDRAQRPAAMLLAVGPEGGWPEREVQQARAAGFVTVSLGPRILRTETAGLAALAIVQHHWGDLG